MDHERLFPWNLPKAVLVSGQSGFKASPTDQRYRLLKLSIIVFAFLYLALTLTSPLSAYFDSARPFSSLLFLWQEILTIADQCFPPSQEAAGSGLADSECSAPVGVCQRLANKGCCSPPQRLCYIHGKLEVKSLNTVINRPASLKLADREECLTNNCCELRWLIWNYPIIAGSQSAALKTTQKAGKSVLINSRSEWVVLKELQSGSRQVI